jgi:RNA-directed DNA polymerase
MSERPSSVFVSTKQRRIAEIAGKIRDKPLTSLSHHINQLWLEQAWALTRKDGALGIDEVSAADYETNLEANLKSLLGRLKSGTYHAPPVRRTYIRKADGGERPLGIPTIEDKVLQRAVVMALEPVYEQEFLPYSHGYRKRRGALTAIRALREGLMRVGGGWVYEVDIKSYFDTLDHQHLRSFLDRRVQDGVIRQVIGKWLNAGVVENGNWRQTESGSPQGGVISPMLANIYLHEVLDLWYEHEVRPRMKGRTELIRYADDFVIWFEREDDARRIAKVLPKRMEKFGLKVHPEKTRLVPFTRPGTKGRDQNGDGDGGSSFDFLGFTHYWTRSRSGYWVIKRKTAKSRLSRKLHEISEKLRERRHEEIKEQQQWLTQVLNGHYNYFGITSNYRALNQIYHGVLELWRYWLNRRSQKPSMPWKRFHLLLERYPLPRPRIVHEI